MTAYSGLRNERVYRTGGIYIDPTGDIDYTDGGQWEVESDDDWILKVDSSHLVGLRDATTITANSSAPTYNSDHILTATGGSNGLNVPIQDQQESTWLGLFKRPGSGTSQTVMGNRTSSNNGGAMVYWHTDNSIRATSRGITTEDVISLPTGLDVGEWYFVLLSHNATSRFFYVRGVTGVTRAGTKTTASPNRNFMVGPGNFTSYSTAVAVAAFQMWSRAITTDAEAGVIADRVITRTGLTVYNGS